MGQDDSKNLIMAAVLSMAVVFAWFAIFPPEPPQQQAPDAAQVQSTLPEEAAPAVPAQIQTRESALETSDRIQIRSEAITGSIALTGARLDDIHLVDYRETLDPGADTVVLLNPDGGRHPYYVEYSWRQFEGKDVGGLPGADTVWQVESGAELTPTSPVTLKWDNGAGLVFRRTIALDDRYMFTVTQSVENTGAQAVSLNPYGIVSRRDLPDLQNFFILHEGAVAMVDGQLTELSYSDLDELPKLPDQPGRLQAFDVTQNGWLGFTDKYWMTTLIAAPGQSFDAWYQTFDTQTGPLYRAVLRLPAVTIEPGSRGEVEQFLFAGAKERNTIVGYQDALQIDRFIDSIDWGWFYFLTKPLSWLLIWVQGFTGNMGWSIIVLTLLVKTALFPLAYKSYVSMSKMKQLQPEMEKIKERCGDDKQKMQQEMMALYKKEKVNPASGCLPILLQIPIFFSLYKVLFVAIEMRHAPFIGWITDLSAPDPTSILNLFGALPWDTPGPESFFFIFSIGVYPVIMGITMWLQQKLNPAPTDPTQATIFAIMPWMFMFMLGTFASGLVIYWCANNIITFAQQYIIMRSQGVEVDLLGNIKSGFKRRKEAEKQ